VATGGYRYGFNGKENDNEVKGDGNSLDFGARIYDPRVGRFLSVDPLAAGYADISPFLYAENSPIYLVDVAGMSAAVSNTVDPPTKTKAEPTIRRYQVRTMVPEENKSGSGWKTLRILGKIGKYTGGNPGYTFLKLIFEPVELGTGDVPIRPKTAEQVLREIAKEHLTNDPSKDLSAEEKAAIFERVKNGTASQNDIFYANVMSSIGLKTGIARIESKVKEEIELYRESSSLPSDKFLNGFKAKGDNYDLEQHVKYNPKNSGFISTTKIQGFNAEYGDYLYVIKWQPNGIDVNAKLGPHGYSYEQEIAVPTQIKNTDIKGAYKYNKDGSLGEFIPNPLYIP